jgi:hypothetical protein
MPVAIGPRFVLEAGFLVLLAVVVGFADLSPALIVLVMALGWLLVSLIEYFAWRQAQAVALAGFEGPPASVVEEEEEVAPPPPPAAPPPPPQPAAEEETVVVSPAAEAPPADAEPQPKAEPSPEAAPTGFQAAPEQRVGHRLEPLQPRPRRRWVFFGPHERRPEQPAEGDREEES